MSDQDPCQGCRHLVVGEWPRRPDCAREAFYGGARCRHEPTVAARPDQPRAARPGGGNG